MQLGSSRQFRSPERSQMHSFGVGLVGQSLSPFAPVTSEVTSSSTNGSRWLRVYELRTSMIHSVPIRE